MGKAKDIIVKPISSKDARRLTRAIHYSGKVVSNSTLHLGVFYNGRCEGVMQYGNPIDKRKVLPLVEGTGWNEMLELNRMAFGEALPRNSESRALSISFKLIKKHYHHIKWVLSFADGTQCGDGTIYRASGFALTGINKNSTIYELPNGEVMAKHGTSKKDFSGAKVKQGFQIRYIYFIDKSYREKLTVPELPFSEIDKMGAGMYKGQKRVKQAIGGNQPNSGGATPTNTLQEVNNG